MGEFFSVQFTSNNILGNLMWMGIGSVLSRLWMGFKGFPFDKKKEALFWALCPLSIFFVMSAITYATQIASTSAINLKANIDRIHLHTQDAATEQMLFLVSVRNSGMDSIVEWGELTVQIGQDKPVKTARLALPDKLSIKDANATISYFGKDALYNKTLLHPVAKGALIRGLLLYEIKNVKRQSLTQPGTKFLITFTDVVGIEHSVDYSWPSQVNPNVEYIPGIDMEKIATMPEAPHDATKR